MNNVSFTGARLVNLNSKELVQIYKEVSSREQGPSFLTYNGMASAEFPENKFKLILTSGTDRQKLSDLLTKSREFLLTITEAPKAALKSLAERGDTLSKNAQNKLVNTLLDGISVRNERVKSDVEKSGIKLPEEIYSGEEVVKAMKEGTFDFAELVIKRK